MNIAVPDHSHFPIAMAAIQRGKHVYCQKPMCHDVAEVRALTEAAVRKGIISQLGAQMASGIGCHIFDAVWKGLGMKPPMSVVAEVQQSWNACLGGERTESHFEQTGPMAEAILLGTVAIRAPDQKLEWDAPRMKFPNHTEAGRFLRRDYRDGWTVHPA